MWNPGVEVWVLFHVSLFHRKMIAEKKLFSSVHLLFSWKIGFCLLDITESAKLKHSYSLGYYSRRTKDSRDNQNQAEKWPPRSRYGSDEWQYCPAKAACELKYSFTKCHFEIAIPRPRQGLHGYVSLHFYSISGIQGILILQILVAEYAIAVVKKIILQ